MLNSLTRDFGGRATPILWLFDHTGQTFRQFDPKQLRREWLDLPRPNDRKKVTYKIRAYTYEINPFVIVFETSISLSPNPYDFILRMSNS